LIGECRCVSDEAAVEVAESADAFLRSLLMGCRCGHGWHEGKCTAMVASLASDRPDYECHCSVFVAAASTGSTSTASTTSSAAPAAEATEADKPAAADKVWCPECSLNFVVGETVQDYSCPNCNSALLPRV
jgi:hypothetical protein